MWIYKITNKVNNKVYIGQSKRPINERFNRHINDAVNNILDTHFARAIRKYGKENFSIEQIDEANNQDELNLKEQYWIRKYDSVKNGYNETDALYKCGGNTYQSKTEAEMKLIEEKIRQTKLGELNPMARAIKMINTETGEEEIFDTIISCARRFKIKGKTSLTTRLNGSVKSLFRGKYKFEYYDK